MNCRNCDNRLRNKQKFCDECGAKVIKNRLMPKVLAQQVNEQFISIDNKFLSTFIDLFKKPEAVIVGYIEGTRKKYIDVLQYFAIALTLAGVQVFLMNTFFKESLDFQNGFMEGFNAASSGKENPLKGFETNIFTNYQSLIYILTIPFSAFGSWLGYYLLGERRYNFTEHIVINLYYYAQYIIVSVVLTLLFLIFGLNFLIISSIVSIITFVYLFYVLKRVFNNSFWEAVARFLFVMVIYFISMAIIVVIGILLVLLFLYITHK